MHTQGTGESRQRARAHLNQRQPEGVVRRIELQVTSERVGPVVLLTIDAMEPAQPGPAPPSDADEQPGGPSSG